MPCSGLAPQYAQNVEDDRELTDLICEHLVNRGCHHWLIRIDVSNRFADAAENPAGVASSRYQQGHRALGRLIKGNVDLSMRRSLDAGWLDVCGNSDDRPQVSTCV